MGINRSYTPASPHSSPLSPRCSVAHRHQSRRASAGRAFPGTPIYCHAKSPRPSILSHARVFSAPARAHTHAHTIASAIPDQPRARTRRDKPSVRSPGVAIGPRHSFRERGAGGYRHASTEHTSRGVNRALGFDGWCRGAQRAPNRGGGGATVVAGREAHARAGASRLRPAGRTALCGASILGPSPAASHVATEGSRRRRRRRCGQRGWR